MLLAGIFRTRLILNNDYNKRTSLECLLNPWPHFYIYGKLFTIIFHEAFNNRSPLVGGQLSAIVMLLMGVERVLAVLQPVIYKKYVTRRVRFAVMSQCFIVTFISLLVGYLCSYLNRDQCVVAVCGIQNSTSRTYSNYNYIIIIGFPIVALILNAVTYVGGKRFIFLSNYFA